MPARPITLEGAKMLAHTMTVHGEEMLTSAVDRREIRDDGRPVEQARTARNGHIRGGG